MSDEVDQWKRPSPPSGTSGALERALTNQKRRTDALATRAPLQAATISKGGLTIKDGGGITVEDGGQITVNGLDGEQIVLDDGRVYLRTSDADVRYGSVSAGVATDGQRSAVWVKPPAREEPADAQENVIIVEGRGVDNLTLGGIFLRTLGQLVNRGDQYFVQVPDGTNRIVIDTSNASLSSPTGMVTISSSGDATLRSTSGDAIVASETGQLSLLQDTSTLQWLIGRTSTAGPSNRTYIWSPGSTNEIRLVGDVIASTLSVTGSKSFRMPHPTKPGFDIMHGSTESPVSGVEYWGEDVIGADGTTVVILPDYFEALVKPGGRTVLVSPIGAPVPVGADRISEGTFTVHGTPGAEFSWLVKGARFGGDFVVEPPSVTHIEPDSFVPDTADTTNPQEA